MTAREMFEKVGYHLVKTDDYKITYCKSLSYRYYYYVEFYKESKYYEIRKQGFGNYFNFDNLISLQKAINKQIEELGWINE